MFKIKLITVDQITKSFTNTINLLEELSQVEQKRIDRRTDRIQELVAENGESQQEIDKANAIASKLKVIFS